MNNKNQFRVLIDLDANASLEEMLETLKSSGDFIKINPSKLLSWIITAFREELFEKCKSQIIQDHFNSKEYLRDLATKIETSNDAAQLLAAALEKIQAKVKNSKKVKGQKHKADQTTSPLIKENL